MKIIAGMLFGLCLVWCYDTTVNQLGWQIARKAFLQMVICTTVALVSGILVTL